MHPLFNRKLMALLIALGTLGGGAAVHAQAFPAHSASIDARLVGIWQANDGTAFAFGNDGVLIITDPDGSAVAGLYSAWDPILTIMGPDGSFVADVRYVIQYRTLYLFTPGSPAIEFHRISG